MSVFGRFKKGRQAAKEHKAGLAEKQKAEEQKPAYRHVPTHAAVDALAGAPSSWRDDDRVRIVEENRRRSAMTASGMGHDTPVHGLGQNPVHTGMTRTSSTLSHVSYPSVYANPVVRLPRAHSYNGSIHPPWGDRSGELIYSPRTDDYFNPGGNLPVAYTGKGKAIERVMAGSSGRGGRTNSKAPSVVGSSSDSTSSDELEMKATRRRQAVSESHSTGNDLSSLTPSTRDTDSAASLAQNPEPQHRHRLHPSKGRKQVDPSANIRDRYYPPSASQRFRSTAHRSPSSSISTVSNIPPVPSLPPMCLATPPVPHSAASSSSGWASSASSVATYTGPSRPSVRADGDRESPTSPITPNILAPASPAILRPSSKASEFDFNFSTTYTSSDSESSPKPRVFSLSSTRTLDATPSPTATSGSHLRTTTEYLAYKPPGVIRFDFEQDMAPSRVAYDREEDLAKASPTPRVLPVDFDEAAFSQMPLEVPAPKPQPPPSAPQKVGRGKLTKTPQVAKPPKASRRWSFSKSGPPVA
ncbi:hypothetical protein MCOR02_010908 [Pyricularia oryzae]|nr:hypothetical protein MCOR02_010908 [Pyricularia oryzae]KAI6308615.1 hypothetical protein MCOR34_007143 [Pyricularia oryzae]KAI6458774.1 hypothetical protein MCOR17_007263 [Pyricularia oryzae]KAI6572029.1 hypothetical protein MCOR04_007743 [Pyricularia oryzae]